MAKSEMQRDIDGWIHRVEATAKDHSEITAPTGHTPWTSSFFGCFDPIDLCAITWCCPCITFGQTHHRLHKDANLAGYSPVNASCLGWWGLSCFGLHCIPNMLQRTDVRTRAHPHLAGDFVTDFLKSWCCSCCNLIQQEKETQHLLSLERTQVSAAQPTKADTMNYALQ